MQLILRTKKAVAPSSPQELAEIILTGRGLSSSDYLGHHGLQDLTPPFSLKNIEKACQRLICALESKERIALITDHDCDGQTSCATLYWCLTKVFRHPTERLSYYIGHRTEEGYGLSDKLCQRLLSAAELPTLVITADCGSSDHHTVALLAKSGIDVIITDHHTVPTQGPPDKAFAVINPNQNGCSFPDKNIAGCFVAWFFMVATRFYWQKRAPEKVFDSLAPALDFVAIGTMADCVSLATSLNNRLAVRYGLKQIRAQKRSCWRALKKTFKEIIDSDFLVFKLIPLINADGRLSNALTGVGFLLASDMITAQEHLAELIQCNEQRRYLQKKQYHEARQLLKEQGIDGRCGIFLQLQEQEHAGIHGVTASRLLEQYQTMVILFSKAHQKDYLVGSARSIDSLSIKNMLDVLNASYPGLIHQYGGHHQAAGLAIAQEKFIDFKRAAENYLQNNQANFSSELKMTVDIFLHDWSVINFEFFSVLEHILEPFGKGFIRPVFLIEAFVSSGKVIGGDKNHLQLDLLDKKTGQELKALLFFTDIASDILEKVVSQKVWFCGQFVLQEFQKEHSVSFFIQNFFYDSGYYDDKTKKLCAVKTSLQALSLALP